MEIEVEQLIALVERNECLYNKHHRDFKIPEKKRYAWRMIAKQLKTTDDQCFKRWRQLRTKLSRELLKRSNSTECTDPPWYLMDAMAFVSPYIKQRRPKRFSHERMTALECSSPSLLEEQFIGDEGDNSSSSSSDPFKSLPTMQSPKTEKSPTHLFQSQMDSSSQSQNHDAKRRRDKDPQFESNLPGSMNANTIDCDALMEADIKKSCLISFGKWIADTLYVFGDETCETDAMEEITRTLFKFRRIAHKGRETSRRC